jgi:hypothetical protein
VIASAALVSIAVVTVIATTGTSGALSSHQPDAWIKVCGPTNTCLLQPWHPWIGNNVYGGSGKGETVRAGVEEVNMVRFWVAIQNDGTSSNTFRVKGCSGSSAFPLKHVDVGADRAFTPGHDITNAFRNGTAKFTIAPASTGRLVILTLTFLAATSSGGVSYACPITVRSTAQTTARDVVVARMVTI